MQKNYLVLAHKNPDQLYRMITALNDNVSHFFIHIDAKSPIAPFKERLQGLPVYFIDKRECCFWGDFSIVRATINLMEAAAKENKKGYFILMSGQDYPIASQKEINTFLEQYDGYDFIDFLPIEDKWKAKMVKDKLFHYHILHSGKRGHSNCYAPFFHCAISQKSRTLFHLLKGRLSWKHFKLLCKLPARKAPFSKQYAGSQFWAFSEKTFYKVLTYIREHHTILEDYYHYTSSSDEIYFHSILINLQSTDTEIKLKPSLTYVNWERKGVQLPVLFKNNDFEELTSQREKLFARKFDIEIDSDILDRLDNFLNNK